MTVDRTDLAMQSFVTLERKRQRRALMALLISLVVILEMLGVLIFIQLDTLKLFRNWPVGDKPQEQSTK